jgi:hypothetical protein
MQQTARYKGPKKKLAPKGQGARNTVQMPPANGSHSIKQQVEKIANGFLMTTSHTRHDPDARKDEDRYQHSETKTYHRVHPALHKSVKGIMSKMGLKAGLG